MKYDICLIGHGEFPTGVKSAIEVLAGGSDELVCFNLDAKTTHEDFKHQVGKFLEKHSQTIVIADMTGGAPFQIVAQMILEAQRPNQYIIASLPLNAILDLFLKNSMDQLAPDTILATFQHVMTESSKLMQYLPNSVSQTNSQPLDRDDAI